MATTRKEYTGTGSAGPFSLGGIDLINNSDLKVYIFEPTRDPNTAVLQLEATNAGTAGTDHPQYNASAPNGTAAGDIQSTTPLNNYQFTASDAITFNVDANATPPIIAPSANAIITLERITTEDNKDFHAQGTIRASELNAELKRIQHIAEEGVNEAKGSIKESRFSANAVDVGHPVSGIDRRIEHVAKADSDDDAVNRDMLGKVITQDLLAGEGIDLTDAVGGTNSNAQVTISGEDSSKTNKGIVKINEGDGIDVNYTNGDAVISGELSTKNNRGIIIVESGHGIKVGASNETDSNYSGSAIISTERSTPTTQGVIKVNQVSGDAINVTHAVGGTVGDVTIGVDRSTASQQGTVRVQSSVPITTTYTADGEVSLSINDNTVDLAKIRNDDVITSAELDASTTTSNYPTPDWDSEDSIATGKALAKRFDAIMYSHTTNKGTPPTETNFTEGKLWYDHLNDQTLSIWDKSGANTGTWRAITSGGTFTSQPKVVYVDSVNGNDLNDGHRIIKAKKTIRGALLDVNENISSTTTTNVTAATYNHQTGLLTVTTNAAHNLRVGMKVTMAGLVWSCNYGGGTNNHTFPEADDPLRFVSNILSNTQFECQLETTVDTSLAHTYVSGGTVTNQAGRVGQGWMISVSAGTYQEILPLRVEADNVSIVGTTMRSCFIHPSNTQRYDTSKDFNASDAITTGTSEYNTMFEMNSGTYIWGFAFSGLKAGGWTTSGGSTLSARGAATGYVPEAGRNEQRTNVDPDATYGLPPVQGWIAAFRPNCSLKKSPYIQNCTSISDTDINNAAYDPVTQTGGLGGDKDSGMTAGGILVDGSVPSATSPLRSFVVDAFTQINMDGPGILCTNNGYAQLVSFFGTFCHYHAKSLNGGMLNLANCTTDYGRYGLIADGKSATTTFTSTVDGAKAAGQTSFNIDATTITSGYFGTGFNNSTANLRPGDNYLVSIGSDTYEIVSATPVGGSWTATNGWTVTIMKTNSTNPAINDGLTNAITDGATVNFYQRSYISTGGHTFEYVGAGTDYRAAPENGGVPIEANEVINRNNGKVWQSSTNHVGKFKVGETFTIDQRSGKVESKGITLTGPVTSNNNDNITIDPAGTGVVTIGSTFNALTGSTIGNLTFANGSITDSSGSISFGNENLSTTGWIIAIGQVEGGSLKADTTTINAATITDTTGAISFGDENLSTTGSITGGSLLVDTTTINAATITDSTGAISFGDENLSTTGTFSAGNSTSQQHTLTGTVFSTAVSTGTVNTGAITSGSNNDITITPGGTGVVKLGKNLDVNGKSIISASNGNIPITPNGSGKVVLDGLNWPTADGSSGYVLKTDGSGNLSWTQVLPASNPTVSGSIVITDNLQLTDDDDSHSISLTAPATVPSNVVLTLPAAAPTANQYLKAGASTPTTLEWENALAITTVQTASSQSAQLALTTQEGDVVIRTDESKTYIKNSGTSNSMSDFTHLQSPTGGVTSFNSNTGTITADQALAAVNAASGTVGTARLGSSGTASSSTFLRGDGSWQTPPSTTVNNGSNNRVITSAGGNALDAEADLTFTSGKLDIGGSDSVKIDLVGANNPTINFKQGNTQKGKILWDSTGWLEIKNDSDGSEIRLKDDLQFSTDGSNFYSILNSNSTLSSSKLSGALPALNGSLLTNLPASGGTFTATASGALTNGKGVLINSNGTVSHPTATAASWGNSNGNLNITGAFNVYPAGNNRFIVANRLHGGSYPSLTAVKINDDNTITTGATVVPWSKSMANLMVAWNPDDEMGIVTGPGSSTYWYYEVMKQFTLGGTNGLTITLGQEKTPIGTSYNNKSEGVASTDLVYIGSNTYAWMYKRGGTSHLRCRLVSNNTGGVSSQPNVTGYSTIQSNDMKSNLSAVWNPDTSSIAIAHTSNESSGTLKIRSIQVGTYSSFSLSSNVSTLSLNTGQTFYSVCIAYDTNNKSYFVTHMKPNGWASGQQQLHGRAINVVSGSFSAGTESQMTTSGDTMYIDQSKNALNYNATSDTLLAITSHHGSSSVFKVKEVTISGTGANPSFSLSADQVIATSLNNESPSIRASTGSDKWLLGYRPTSSTTSWLSRTPASTTLTNDKYVGFADGSFSNGATATIQLPNTVVDGLSGLTAGNKYFVGGDGTPDATDTYGKSVTAGVALSSSTLLLK